ncbi:hemagglutinin/amebocyte aggregation factor-like [Lepisosteus oculatus]|uniref:Si:dkey-14d8.7 n=1 Tax=Lepisosteus oculatus TaxID=7918 RepID=W5MV20_LEPOC|nr:PREDICTED: hemagglutinin/amebocyte aggregation factor-like [Lepisosteus oculatus]
MKKIILFVLTLVVSAQEPRWENEYDQPLHFTCPSYESIYYISSTHHNKYEDRLWSFSCKRTFENIPLCSWSGYVNDFDQQFEFTCPPNSAISGMYSYHDNKREDRRWKFYCCSDSKICYSNCKWTDYVNGFDEPMSWTVPSSYYLVGASSYHDNHREDRRWKYQICMRHSC